MIDKKENISELEDILVGLLIELKAPIITQMIALAIIRAGNLHQEMVNWVATFSGKEDMLTVQSFMSKLHELTE